MAVDSVTGEIIVERITAVHDSGKTINRLGAEGQAYGGVTQGAGYGIWERISAPGGFIAERNFDRYSSPPAWTSATSKWSFSRGGTPMDPGAPSHWREPALELTAAAVANAVGRGFRRLPLSQEEVVLGR